MLLLIQIWFWPRWGNIIRRHVWNSTRCHIFITRSLLASGSSLSSNRRDEATSCRGEICSVLSLVAKNTKLLIWKAAKQVFAKFKISCCLFLVEKIRPKSRGSRVGRRLFTGLQLLELEKTFSLKPYLSRAERVTLAEKIVSNDSYFSVAFPFRKR